jgi:beta-lactamase regulating signal transducer with metallopeptidase domain
MSLILRQLIPEGRAFVVGRISAASTYVTGAFTTASGAAKAAADSGHGPAWLPSITVDTMVLLIGAVITVLTGLVSIWAKRADVRAKRSERLRREREEERERRAWVMTMLSQHGEDRMAQMFGPHWRRAAEPVDSTLGDAR